MRKRAGERLDAALRCGEAVPAGTKVLVVATCALSASVALIVVTALMRGRSLTEVRP